MATDERLEKLVAELRAVSAAEKIQVRDRIAAIEAEVASLKIQVENASTPQAVDYGPLEAAIAAVKQILPDDPEPAETPTTTPLLPNSDESLTATDDETY